MNNKNKLTLAIGTFFLFLIMNAALFFAVDEFLLIYNLSDVVVFSWRMFAILFFYPLACYFCIAIFYYLYFSKLPNKNNSIFKFLTFIGILGFVISFPVSWYADFKLKENGYITCYKKSLNAPNKYVKNKKLCD
ncbi:DUF1240 domain-containing protein [Xenorhabdus bovienii]|uniref:DUF1240 domain-containing protein n=2 Tax=Xenorhabdus bovienii TaxID=40576 RepID=UPI00237CA266|nr:DUF1240 domain-containing protein [Xenorhabdus bovienii]MDE1475694.1 DUF1240 domain-containing protein [Xenorhabdus bovienii]MDE9430114.1 DUF1240 domain-containing protein [Xenorhabdus bovienii]MDE9433781.1 DUF1240 domain-containing protein [Xenorhabdus bovienii]MDE9442703.1 DUF1240 domain-containing protein [Xenorhabdus bovienii]MDE9454112.1 DUF1240 domain-containing protein [Xenorhabdus bovienii]